MKSIHSVRIKVIVFSLCFAALSLKASDPKYPVSSIPETLKKNMYAVVRDEQTVFEIFSQKSSGYYYRKVITILNTNASDYATIRVGYDKETRIESFKANVYDGEGKLIKKVKQSEMTDQSSISGFSLYEDDRVKYIDLSQSVYPYTIEVEYEIKMNFLFFIPDYTPCRDDEISIQKSSYTINYPLTLKPRYKCINIKEPDKKFIATDNESFTWAFTDIIPTRFEPLGNSTEFLPRVMLAPTTFEYAKYIGDMTTWNDFGKWIISLNKGRNVLPEETKRRVRQLTENLKTTEEKAKVLYEFMQNKTRYVNIRLGIGGLQPFEALTVDQTGYGDCKALSNYMVSLLEVAGIKAYYTLIYSGYNAPSMEVDFPCSQFNHAVVFVPNKIDTIWLECTSQTNPFGYMGTFTGDRKALAITENGAQIVRTPVYKAEQNTQSSKADVYIEKNGNAKTKLQTKYSGVQYENGNLDFVLSEQYEDQKKWVQKNISIPNFDINTFAITSIKNKIPSANVLVELTLNRFATINGKRMFIMPNLINRSSFIPEKVESRKSKVVLKTTFIDFDTIRYHLPDGIYPEFVPESVKFNSVFGEYESSYKLDGNTFLYTRRFKRNKGEYPAKTYQELIDFYRNISRADNLKIVFLNKT